MTRLILAAAFALLASSASAQTVEATINPLALGFGYIEVPQAVETDGNEATQEWLLKSTTTGEYRVIAVSAEGRMCSGGWFPGRTAVGWFAPPELQKVGGVHKLISRDALNGTIVVTKLDTPVCESQH